MIDVAIDLNCRAGCFGQGTFAGYEHVRGDHLPVVGQMVRAVEEETGVSAPAIVVELDTYRRLIYLAVAWKEFTDRPWGRWIEATEEHVPGW